MIMGVAFCHKKVGCPWHRSWQYSWPLFLVIPRMHTFMPSRHDTEPGDGGTGGSGKGMLKEEVVARQTGGECVLDASDM